ncbi:MAG: hypothetical protein HZA48_05585 [Planctomycetes bacterium]|nr:hypothetical protein [Planctomycetota bacterium]
MKYPLFLFLLALMPLTGLSCGKHAANSVKTIDAAVMEDISGNEITEYHLWVEIRFLDENGAQVRPVKGIVFMEYFLENETNFIAAMPKETEKTTELNDPLWKNQGNHMTGWQKTGKDHACGDSLFIHIKSGIRPSGENKKISITVTYTADDPADAVAKTITR